MAVSSTARSLVGLQAHLAAQVDDYRLHRFAGGVGLPSASLRRLGIGFATREDGPVLGMKYPVPAWTFPMLDAHGALVGVRIRLRGGKKLCAKGSYSGLFLPSDIGGHAVQLFICEGETDTAAALALGLAAIGRPGCRSGSREVLRLVRRLRPRNVVVIADDDGPGRHGADDLAASLAPHAEDVRVAVAPGGDLRDWVRAGARRSDVDRLVQEAQPHGIAIRVAGRSSR